MEYYTDRIKNTSDVFELACIYASAESMIDYDYEESSWIMEAVEKRIEELDMEAEFNSAMGWE